MDDFDILVSTVKDLTKTILNLVFTKNKMSPSIISQWKKKIFLICTSNKVSPLTFSKARKYSILILTKSRMSSTTVCK